MAALGGSGWTGRASVNPAHSFNRHSDSGVASRSLRKARAVCGAACALQRNGVVPSAIMRPARRPTLSHGPPAAPGTPEGAPRSVRWIVL